MLLDEARGGCTQRDDQIRRSLSIERLKIFNKSGISGVVPIQRRDEGLFLNVQRPRRLFVQFSLNFPAPCGTLLEIRAERMKQQNLFRLSGSLASLGLRGSRAN